MKNLRDIIGENVFHYRVRWMFDRCIVEDYMDEELILTYLRPIFNDVWRTGIYKSNVIQHTRREVKGMIDRHGY